MDISFDAALKLLTHLPKFNLCWKLALVLKGKASAKLLESYEIERLPVIAQMLKMTTHLLSRDFMSGSALSQVLHDAASAVSDPIPKAEKKAWTRDRKLFQVGAIACVCMCAELPFIDAA